MVDDYLLRQTLYKRNKEVVENPPNEEITISKPIISYRKFSILARRPILVGSFFTIWSSRELTAVCQCKSLSSISMSEHYAKNFFEATCGIYSFKELHPSTDILGDYSDLPVTAIIQNYGYILELEYGYRSEIAIIDRLFVNYQLYKNTKYVPYSETLCPDHLKDSLESIYKVPVNIHNYFSDNNIYCEICLNV